MDLQKGTLSFPGGGIVLKHLTDIIKPRYIFQRYLRFDLPLSQIRMVVPRGIELSAADADRLIERSVHRYKTPEQQDAERAGAALGLLLGPVLFGLELNWEFGAVKIYMSPQRRDELYSLIRSYVEMGIPVSEAAPAKHEIEQTVSAVDVEIGKKRRTTAAVNQEQVSEVTSPEHEVPPPEQKPEREPAEMTLGGIVVAIVVGTAVGIAILAVIGWL